ncbi:hypothetical protein PMAYCL1PPCAC_21837, partial [Pristionchus mayeri]
ANGIQCDRSTGGSKVGMNEVDKDSHVICADAKPTPKPGCQQCATASITKGVCDAANGCTVGGEFEEKLE